jgi:hypothetical protein
MVQRLQSQLPEQSKKRKSGSKASQDASTSKGSVASPEGRSKARKLTGVQRALQGAVDAAAPPGTPPVADGPTATLIVSFPFFMHLLYVALLIASEGTGVVLGRDADMELYPLSVHMPLSSKVSDASVCRELGRLWFGCVWTTIHV